MADLDDLKKKQTEEFLGYLELLQFEPGIDSLNQGTCVICIEEYSSGELIYRTPTCKHIFHEECTRGWFISKN